MLELIEIIRENPKYKRYHFVSFLDGVYFNILWKPEKAKLLEKADERSVKKTLNKIESQTRDIVQALKNNPGNYFINTAGFSKLFS